MEENIAKTLTYTSSVILCIAAFTLFFMLHHAGIATISIVNNAITDKGTVYETHAADHTITSATGASIIGSIRNGLETDIIIDAVTIQKNTDIHTFNYSLIDAAAWYTMEYVFKPCGNIGYIHYMKQ